MRASAIVAIAPRPALDAHGQIPASMVILSNEYRVNGVVECRTLYDSPDPKKRRSLRTDEDRWLFMRDIDALYADRTAGAEP